jgi:transcriptional regulator with XRE-family HTH domain
MGRHRDPAFEQLSRTGQHAFEAERLARDRLRVRRQMTAQRVAGGRVSSGRVTGPRQPEEPAVQRVRPERASPLRRQVSAAIRAGRAELGLSQRELAGATGISQSVVSRLESGVDEPSLAALVRALAAVGARLVVVTDVPPPSRMTGEHARDRVGRRLPAHLAPYRLAEPHSWWPGVTNARLWHDEPRWSYRRRPP